MSIMEPIHSAMNYAEIVFTVIIVSGVYTNVFICLFPAFGGEKTLSFLIL